MEFITTLIKKNWQNKRVQKAAEHVREEECESYVKKYFYYSETEDFRGIDKVLWWYSKKYNNVLKRKYVMWRNIFIIQKLKIFEELTKFSGDIRRNITMFWRENQRVQKAAEHVREEECESYLKKYFYCSETEDFRGIDKVLWWYSKKYNNVLKRFEGISKCFEDFSNKNILASIVRKVNLLYYRSQ